VAAVAWAQSVVMDHQLLAVQVETDSRLILLGVQQLQLVKTLAVLIGMQVVAVAVSTHLHRVQVQVVTAAVELQYLQELHLIAEQQTQVVAVAQAATQQQVAQQVQVVQVL
jgi:hypothetical protein